MNQVMHHLHSRPCKLAIAFPGARCTVSGVRAAVLTSGALADHQCRKWQEGVLSVLRQPQLRRGTVPQKWQRWIPFEIDAFFGSPAVQAMHPAAQMGYWRLICAQWQTDDCALSGDPLDLAEKSGLGDEMWGVYASRILRQFVTLSERSASGNGALSVRNPQCY